MKTPVVTTVFPRGPLVAALLLRLLLPAAAIVFGGSVAGADGSGGEGVWSRFITPDTSSYLTPARHLLERGAFSNLSGPEIFRTPGYPLVLTLGLTAGHPFLVTLLIQALAGTLTVWCIMRTASLLFRNTSHVSDASSARGGGSDGEKGEASNVRVVARCGWLAACEPLALACGAMMLADTLLTAAVGVAVLLVVMHLRQPSTRTALTLGATLAAAAYIKPIAYYLPVVLIPSLCLVQRRAAPTRERETASSPSIEFESPYQGDRNHSPPLLWERGPGGVGRGSMLAIAAATFALLVGAWQVRNGLQTGFWGFSTLTARAVYVTAGGGVTAARDGRAFGDVREERLGQAAIHTAREADHIGDMYRRGISDVLGSPVTAVAVHVKGMLLTLFDPASLDYLRLFGAYPATSPVTRYGGQGLAATAAAIARAYPVVAWCSLLLEAILLAYLALAARGAWRALRAGVPEARLLLLIAAYFLLLSGGIFGTARFRLPIMPVVILLGGYALSSPHPSPLPAGGARE